MDDSSKMGFMAVFAVSGSVAFFAMQAHKHLLSNFMKKMEFEMKNSAGPKKKVRFARDVVEATAEKSYGKKHLPGLTTAATGWSNGENLEAMPENWQVMYKGILQCRNLRGGRYN